MLAVSKRGINEALGSILPAVEGKPGWTVDHHDDGRVENLTIEGHNEAADAREENKGELVLSGFETGLGPGNTTMHMASALNKKAAHVFN